MMVVVHIRRCGEPVHVAVGPEGAAVLTNVGDVKLIDGGRVVYANVEPNTSEMERRHADEVAELKRELDNTPVRIDESQRDRREIAHLRDELHRLQSECEVLRTAHENELAQQRMTLRRLHAEDLRREHAAANAAARVEVEELKRERQRLQDRHRTVTDATDNMLTRLQQCSELASCGKLDLGRVLDAIAQTVHQFACESNGVGGAG